MAQAGPSSPARRTEVLAQARPPIKRALLFAFEYKHRAHEDLDLIGAHKDADRLKSLLIDLFGFEEKNIKVVLDEGTGPGASRIMKEMRWLKKDVRPGDSLFFHFSGHGDQMKNLNGGESDSEDEVMCPPTHKFRFSSSVPAPDELEASHRPHRSRTALTIAEMNQDRDIKEFFWQHREVKDDTIHRILVRGLPVGCRLTALIDACHAGSILDLPHYHCNRVHPPGGSANPPRCPECARLDGNWKKKSTRHSWKSFFKSSICHTELSNTDTAVVAEPQGEVDPQVSCMTPLWSFCSTWASCLPRREQWRSYFKWRARSAEHHDGYSPLPTEDPLMARKERPVSTRQPSADSIDVTGTMPDRRRFMSPEPDDSSDEDPHEVAEVISWSASRDNQRSFGSDDGGRMVEAFCRILRERPEISYKDLLTKINFSFHKAGTQLASEYPNHKDAPEWIAQEAQLGSSNRLNLEDIIRI
ncbi:peptidase C14 [Sistotremastrum niveocremeum HHB9708]|uniref:Peptidase C14 n=1 Tax=Sistotremastrum niveocremeum HHB9708 TaxID=1314777 RepID=A0A164XYS8_9AGAM|nr:peptidase C14 [Sistotremastrum niveocremeum HHB9708]